MKTGIYILCMESKIFMMIFAYTYMYIYWLSIIGFEFDAN